MPADNLVCMKPDEPTVAFGVSKFLMSIEGPSNTLGLLVSRLYGDGELSRKEWSVSHTAANRPEFVKQLLAAGQQRRRIGIAVHTQQAVVRISMHFRPPKAFSSRLNHARGSLRQKTPAFAF